MSGRAHELFQHPVFANGAVGGLYNNDMLIGGGKGLTDAQKRAKQHGKGANKGSAALKPAAANARSQGAELANNVFQKGVEAGHREAEQADKAGKKKGKKNKKAKGARGPYSAERRTALRRSANLYEKAADAESELADMEEASPSGPAAPGSGKPGGGAATSQAGPKYSPKKTAKFLADQKEMQAYWPDLKADISSNYTTGEMLYKDDWTELKLLFKGLKTMNRQSFKKRNPSATIALSDADQQEIMDMYTFQAELRKPFMPALVRRYEAIRKGGSWLVVPPADPEFDGFPPEVQDKLLNRRVQTADAGGESAEGAAAVAEVSAEELAAKKQEEEAKNFAAFNRGEGAQPSILQRLNMI